MREPKDLINWVELSRFLAGNETSVSRNRCPTNYQYKVISLIKSIERWGKENEDNIKMTEQDLHDYNKWLTEVWSEQHTNIPFMIDAPQAYLKYRKK